MLTQSKIKNTTIAIFTPIATFIILEVCFGDGKQLTFDKLMEIILIVVIASAGIFIISHQFYKKLKPTTQQDMATPDVQRPNAAIQKAINLEMMKQQKLELEEKYLQERKARLEDIITWVEVLFSDRLSGEYITVLQDNIRTLSNDNEFEHEYHAIPVKFNGITNTDLQHMGWTIGKRLDKMNIHIAAFLKDTFPEMFANVETTTISAKLTNTDGRYTLGVIHPKEDLIPHVFPEDTQIARTIDI